MYTAGPTLFPTPTTHTQKYIILLPSRDDFDSVDLVRRPGVCIFKVFPVVLVCSQVWEPWVSLTATDVLHSKAHTGQ